MRAFIWFIAFLFLVCPQAFSDDKKPSRNTSQTIELHECSEKKLGLKFLCNLDWIIETDKDAILVVMADEPAVTMTLAQAKSPVIFFEQLDDEALKGMGQYVSGFTKKQILIGGEKAWQIKGFSKGYPEIQLLDFYFIHDLKLYSVLFSVDPKQDFDNYEELFTRIAQSIVFFDPPAAK